MYWRLLNKLDISVPFYSAGSALLVPWPDEESRLLAPIYPFQPTVNIHVPKEEVLSLCKCFPFHVFK